MHVCKMFGIEQLLYYREMFEIFKKVVFQISYIHKRNSRKMAEIYSLKRFTLGTKIPEIRISCTYVLKDPC
jgi:hypothetical protein